MLDLWWVHQAHESLCIDPSHVGLSGAALLALTPTCTDLFSGLSPYLSASTVNQGAWGPGEWLACALCRAGNSVFPSQTHAIFVAV